MVWTGSSPAVAVVQGARACRHRGDALPGAVHPLAVLAGGRGLDGGLRGVICVGHRARSVTDLLREVSQVAPLAQGPPEHREIRNLYACAAMALYMSWAQARVEVIYRDDCLCRSAWHKRQKHAPLPRDEYAINVDLESIEIYREGDRTLLHSRWERIGADRRQERPVSG